MTTTQQAAAVIEWVPPAALKAHQKNAELYGDTADPSLVESVRRLGVQQAIYAKRDGTIISGHRRWLAAQACSLTDIPVIRVSFSDEADEWEAIVEHNRYRQKNGEQFYNEGRLLEAVEAERARQRQVATQNNHTAQAVKENLPEQANGQTRDHVATTIGLGSGRQWDKLKEIGERADAGDRAARDVLPKIGTSLSLHSAWKTVARAEQRQEEKQRITSLDPLRGTYNVLVIDPPWAYENRPDDPTHRGANPYETMTYEQLAALVLPADDDSILWLWTTNSFLEDAFRLMRQWGFQYKTMLTWAKPKFGVGDWLRGQTEHCLLGVRGSYRIQPRNASTLLEAPMGSHSQKPVEFYALVERLCHGNKIDIFARERRDGWEVWGAQAD